MVLLNGQLVEAEDRCPLHLGERRVLHRVPNLSVGLDLAASCEAAIFGPALVAQPLVAAGDLVEVQVRDWAVEDPISIICAAERVRSRVQAAALAEVSALLAAPQGNSR
ncbi:MAG: hypothetical protein IPJ65_41165 [Archangiaceae bacterium]|nr:hypothetical protein [Archangiaceae bacterium]